MAAPPEQARSEGRPHPVGREAADLAHGLLERIGAGGLLSRRWARGWVAAFVAVALAAVLAIPAMLGVVVDEPLLFPSLGPTAFLVVFVPDHHIAAPRNILYGHLAGIAAGVGALFAFGLYTTAPAFQGPLTWQEAAAAVLAIVLTGVLTVLLGSPHPPAAATALVVGLGLVTSPADLLALAGGVVALTAAAALLLAVVGLPWHGFRTGSASPPTD